MNDTNEPRDDMAASYDRLRSSVEPTVAVESALDDLHATTSRRAMPRGWSVAAIGLSAAAVLAVAFLVVTGPDEQPTASPGPTPSTVAPATAVVPAEDDPCTAPQIVVYVEPAATPEVVDGVRDQLSALDPSAEWDHLDGAATYEEFRRLFAESPDLLDSIRPEELPTSFRREVSGELTSIDLEAMDAIPGTLRVEATEQYAAIMCGGDVTPPPMDLGVTTTSITSVDGASSGEGPTD